MKRIGSFNIERCVLVFSYLIIWLGCWLNSFTWPPPEKAGKLTGRPPDAKASLFYPTQRIQPFTQGPGIAVACCGIIYRADDTIKEETVFLEPEAKILKLFR